jgi:hypothetical protein
VNTAGVTSYAINATNAVGSGLGNYAISYVPGTLTVGLANLTVRANDTGKAYGDPLTFAGNEFTAIGLYNSDSVTNASLASDGAAAGAAVGNYTISISNASGTGLTNYTLAYVNGTLAVTNGLFRIRSVTVSNGVATVVWTSQDGKTYRLLYKDNVAATNWSVVPGDVTITGARGSKIDFVGNVAQRFYRVMVLTNSAPAMPTQSSKTIDELTTLSVTNAATDADLPNELLTYSLLSAPTNAAISATGIITWTPTEGQGPSTNTFTTAVTDNGGLSATNSFVVVVNEVNSAPVLPGQINRTMNEQTLLTVTNTASDSDVPANPLSYVLTGPNGAVIDGNGVITWTPTVGQGPSTNTFTTVVTDTNAAAVYS